MYERVRHDDDGERACVYEIANVGVNRTETRVDNDVVMANVEEGEAVRQKIRTRTSAISIDPYALYHYIHHGHHL